MAEERMEAVTILGCSERLQPARNIIRIDSSRIQKSITPRINIKPIRGKVIVRELALVATFGVKICRSQHLARRASSRRGRRKYSSNSDRMSTGRVRTPTEDTKRRPRLPMRARRRQASEQFKAERTRAVSPRHRTTDRSGQGRSLTSPIQLIGSVAS